MSIFNFTGEFNRNTSVFKGFTGFLRVFTGNLINMSLCIPKWVYNDPFDPVKVTIMGPNKWNNFSKSISLKNLRSFLYRLRSFFKALRSLFLLLGSKIRITRKEEGVSIGKLKYH